MRRWSYSENEHCWQLFAQEIVETTYQGQKVEIPTMDAQIIKALKPNKDFKSPMAEYWPTEEDAKFIVDALNRAELEKALTEDDQNG